MLIEKVTQTIEKYRMLSGGERVLTALSGGADSVCLLLVLKELEKKYALTLSAIHINHCIRDGDADMDEQFCRELCKRLGIELTVIKEDVPAISAREKLSVEEAARNIRYAAFAQHSKKGLVATAHTASDNAETVLLNLVRGTGLRGLCGIPPVRDNIIRPLIEVTRQEVEKFLEMKNQDFVNDITNNDVNYTRNRIRHKIIPEILRINNGFFKTFCAELKIFSEENFYIEKCAKNAYNICIDNGALKGLEKYDAVIRKRCISKFLTENGLSVNAEKINSVDSILEIGGKVNLSKNVFAVCRKNVLTIVRTPEKIGTAILIEGENHIFDRKILFAEIKDGSGGIIDTGKVHGEIILRGRNYGDKIRLAGREHTSSVKKLLGEKVRADIRPYLHFLADSEGLIFIEGIGVAERVKTDENTRKSLYITVKDANGND